MLPDPAPKKPLKRAELLAGKPYPVLDLGFVKYVAHLGDDLTPLEAARMSTQNPTGVDPEHDTRTRDYLWRHAHATPFEMAVLQLEVQLPLFVAREWQRHRTMSYNEMSGRYTELPPLNYVPARERVVGQDVHNKQGSSGELPDEAIDEFLSDATGTPMQLRDRYNKALHLGVAKELARINLPLSQYTRFRVQANLRNWLHFLNLRMAPNAQWEIRAYAYAVAAIIQELWPQTWAVFEEHTLHAVTLSRTEVDLVRMLLTVAAQSFPSGYDEDMAHFEQLMGQSRMREFKAKLGLEP